jgi:hypothetical protein
MKIIDDEPAARPRPRTDNAKTELSSQRPFVSLHPAKDSLPEGDANSGASSSRYSAPMGCSPRSGPGKTPSTSPPRERSASPGFRRPPWTLDVPLPHPRPPRGRQDGPLRGHPLTSRRNPRRTEQRTTWNSCRDQQRTRAGRPCVQSRIGIGPSRPRIRGELECCLAGQAAARQAASPGRRRMDQRDAI